MIVPMYVAECAPPELRGMSTFLGARCIREEFPLEKLSRGLEISIAGQALKNWTVHQA